MTRLSLSRLTCQSSGLSLASCDRVAVAFFEAITEILSDDGRVEFRGHFTIEPRTRKARPARNPRNGDKVMLTERKTAWVTFSPGLKKDVALGPKRGYIESYERPQSV